MIKELEKQKKEKENEVKTAQDNYNKVFTNL